jgi:hypothetical protein
LVRLRAIDPTKPVFGRITVRAEPQNFVLDGHRSEGSNLGLLTQALGKDKQAWFERRKQAELALRRRVAALAAVKPLAPSGMNPASGAQVDLFCCSFVFAPDWSSEDRECAQ